MHWTLVNVRSSQLAVAPQSEVHVSDVPDPPLKTHPVCVLGS